jgi:hypothetical protein
MKIYSAQINLLPFLSLVRESLQTHDHSMTNHSKQHSVYTSNLRSPKSLRSCIHSCIFTSSMDPISARRHTTVAAFSYIFLSLSK